MVLWGFLFKGVAFPGERASFDTSFDKLRTTQDEAERDSR